jgi:hypothetical protein
MPIYISRGRFTSDAVKGMLANPENREEAVAKLFQNVGGRLIAIGWRLVSSRTRKRRLPRSWLLPPAVVCPTSRRQSL